jgi:hypothetical protein
MTCFMPAFISPLFIIKVKGCFRVGKEIESFSLSFFQVIDKAFQKLLADAFALMISIDDQKHQFTFNRILSFF